MAGLWPVVVTARRPGGDEIVLRALRRRDRSEWEALRADNLEWLSPWEATDPFAGRAASYRDLLAYYRREAGAGRLQPFVIEYAGRIVGQMHLSGITWGAMRSASAGYWVSHRLAGRGIAPLALAAVIDHAIHGLGLHRVEVNIRPENAASLRVVAKLGLREEGVRRGYLHIDGAWCDHRCFAVTAEELGDASMVRLLATGGLPRAVPRAATVTEESPAGAPAGTRGDAPAEAPVAGCPTGETPPSAPRPVRGISQGDSPARNYTRVSRSADTPGQVGTPPPNCE